jgi:mono/diheme cytochrome c family protein
MSSAARWLVALGLVSTLPVHAAEPLAARARGVLECYCYQCHGRGGTAKGGFGYVLDRDRLVNHKKIVPGKADESELYQRVRDREMPPKGKTPRPTPQDVALLEKWIAAGAPALPSPPRTFVSTAELHRLMREDLHSISARHRKFIRYLSFTHLYNAGRPDTELRTAGQALSMLVNSLSWHPRINRPHPVDTAQTLFRIDLRDHRWTARTWDRLVAVYPYRQPPEDTAARAIAGETGCEDFHLRGDWFVATASRGKLYYDTLELPTTDRAVERLLQVDVARDLREETVARAGFNGSGVSKNNRILERHDAAFGAYWRSYDFRDNTERQNIFEHPLGPAAGKVSFRPAGGEVIFHLPNGFHGYFLVNGDGRRVEKAPVEIVSDPLRPDRQVEAGLSCLTCHARGLIPKDDQVRGHIEKNRTAFARDTAETIRALYPPSARFRGLLEHDNRRYARALEEAGVVPDEHGPVSAVTLRYEGVIDQKAAAAELGFRPEALGQEIARTPAVRRILGPLQARGGTVQRQLIEEEFPRLLAALHPGGEVKTAVRSPEPPADAFTGHTDAVLCVGFSADGKRALSGSQDQTLRLWDVSTGKLLRTLEGHNGVIRCLALTSDGKRALSGSDDRTVRVWDLETGKELRRLLGHGDRVRAVALSPDGKRALSAGDDRTVRLWDLEKGQEMVSLSGHTGPVLSVAFSRDGRRALSGGADGLVRLWDLARGREVESWQAHRRAVRAVAFAPGGKQAVSGGDDRAVRLWNLKTRKLQRVFEGHGTAVLFVAFSPDGRRVFSAGGQNESPDHFLRSWNAGTGTERSHQGGEIRVWCAAFTADGTLALTGGPDRRLRLWVMKD